MNRNQRHAKHLRLIYVLRAQCEPCKLDKMVVFYRIPNGVISRMYRGHEEEMKKRWSKQYKCTHDITFTREVDPKYLWDVKNNKAVERK